MPMILLPLLMGGARPWIWAGVAAIFALGMAVLLWMPEMAGTGPMRAVAPANPQEDGRGRVWIAMTKPALIVVLLYPLIQAAPLPVSLVERLSPVRWMWIERAAEAASSPSGSFAAVSYAPLTTFFAWLWWLFLAGYARLFHMALISSKGSAPGWLLIPLLSIAGFEALCGLLQTLMPGAGAAGESGAFEYAHGTFVNRNHYAAFLGMLWPVLASCLAVSIDSRDHPPGPGRGGAPCYGSRSGKPLRFMRHGQLVLAGVTGLVLLALFLSGSRGGIVGSLAAMTVMAVFLRFRRRLMPVLAVLGWVVLFSYGATTGFDRLIERFNMVGDNIPIRLRIWEDTLRMVRDHPFTGVGLGNYYLAFRVYQSHLPEDRFTDHAHNDYLQLAAELGVPMAVLISVFAWGFWWWRALRLRRIPAGRGRRTEERRFMAVGALAGGAAFLIHNWVEFNWQIPAAQLYFVMLLVLMGMDGSREG